MALLATDEPPFRQVIRHGGRPSDALQKGYFDFCPRETWSPCVNLYETEEAYIVCVDLAGVEKEKIDIVVDHHNLQLRGHRIVPIPGDGPRGEVRFKIHLLEIDHGDFCRDVELPRDVNKESIRATHRNGFLWIELPKN